MTSKKITVGNTPKVKVTLDAILKFIERSASSITDEYAPEGFSIPQQLIDKVQACRENNAEPQSRKPPTKAELKLFEEWERYRSADNLRERINRYYLALEQGNVEEASMSLFQAGYWMGRLHILDNENELWSEIHSTFARSDTHGKGRRTAAKNEEVRRQKLAQPLFKWLKDAAEKQKFESCERALIYAETETTRFEEFFDLVRQKKISYNKWLKKHATTIWNQYGI